MDFSGEERLQEARFLDCKQVQEGTATSQTSKQVNWPVAACAAASCRINISNICIYIYMDLDLSTVDLSYASCWGKACSNAPVIF